MKKLSVKKLLVLFTLIAMVCMFATTVKASSPINLIPPAKENTQTPVTTNTQTTPPTTTNTTTNTTKINTVTANVTTNTNQNTNLPQTGDASDYIIFLFIAVCVVVAIYAFRKYKNYNI